MKPYPKFKPCPFCGRKNVDMQRHSTEEHDGYAIWCFSCGAVGSIMKTEHGAWNRWNAAKEAECP